LEAAANQLTSQAPAPSKSSSLPTQNNPHGLPAPLDGLLESLNTLVPKKNRKRLRTQDEDGGARAPSALPVEELLKFTVADLVALARERSKGAMSEANRVFFSQFFEEQRKLLVIKAIEQQVSMEMVDTFL
jgi:hypothetical protein